MGRSKKRKAGDTADKQVQNVFELEEDTRAERELHNRKRYEGTDKYEYEMPEDFEDEEINSDEAFNAEDRKKYAHLLASTAGDEGDSVRICERQSRQQELVKEQQQQQQQQQQKQQKQQH
jgi:hypothetical protein